MLLLRKITELIVAPSLSKNAIIQLDYLVKECLSLRNTEFPRVPLRPKHHYMLHYAWAILQFGPVSHCSTLRFESKHSYFKRVTRAKKNFVSICSTLATSHQLLQACLLKKGLFSTQLDFSSATCSARIAHCVKDNGFLLGDCSFAKYFTNNGIRYAIDDYIVLSIQDCDLVIGKIVAIFFASNIPYVLVEKKQARFYPHYGVYIIQTSEVHDIGCLKVNEFHDYYPLHCYIVASHTQPILVLKHFIA